MLVVWLAMAEYALAKAILSPQEQPSTSNGAHMFACFTSGSPQKTRTLLETSTGKPFV